LPDQQPVSETEGYSNSLRQPAEDVWEPATPLQTEREKQTAGVQIVEHVVAQTTMASNRSDGDGAAIATSAPAVENPPAHEGPANPIFSEQSILMIQNPIYPERAKKEGWEGTVVLEVFIDSQGRPERVAINRSSGFAVLDQAAREAVKNWRFRPAQWGGRHIASTGRVPIVFRLDVKN
jgi:TonB family protein